ncbi:hypothetical protein ACFU93_45110 [Streptomyces sp. NPDC057611]|uniref:hypothetical protein n=1 Tax=Streptomyces sp. NPDC057611 TaxID=3346182 RepID=UPI003681CF38
MPQRLDDQPTRLRERLEREFDQHLDITGLVTRLDGVDDIDADLVISTVPLSGHDAPLVVVNVFPTWKDIESRHHPHYPQPRSGLGTAPTTRLSPP